MSRVNASTNVGTWKEARSEPNNFRKSFSPSTFWAQKVIRFSRMKAIAKPSPTRENRKSRPRRNTKSPRRQRAEREDSTEEPNEYGARKVHDSGSDTSEPLTDTLEASVIFEQPTELHHEELQGMLRCYGRRSGTLARLLIEHSQVSTLVLLEEFPIAVISCLPYGRFRDALPRTEFPLEDTAWMVCGTLCLNFPLALLPHMWRTAVRDQVAACSLDKTPQETLIFQRKARRHVLVGFAERRPKEDWTQCHRHRSKRKSRAPGSRTKVASSSRAPWGTHQNNPFDREWFFPCIADQMVYQSALETQFLSPETGMMTASERTPVAMLIDTEKLLQVCDDLELQTQGQIQQQHVLR
jgi:hypothetical protein